MSRVCVCPIIIISKTLPRTWSGTWTLFIDSHQMFNHYSLWTVVQVGYTTWFRSLQDTQPHSTVYIPRDLHLIVCHILSIQFCGVWLQDDLAALQVHYYILVESAQFKWGTHALAHQACFHAFSSSRILKVSVYCGAHQKSTSSNAYMIVANNSLCYTPNNTT